MRSRARNLTSPANAYALASVGAIVLFLLVIAIAVLAYAQDITVKGKPVYIWLLREEGAVEKLTAILLFLSALFALIAAFRVPETLRWARPFLVLLSAFSALMALEEISWGQRLFDIEPSAFFQQHSDQKEINLHNVVQRYLKQSGFTVTKTRQIAAIMLLVYGVALPVLSAFAPRRSWLRKCRVVVPPPALIPGFFAGALLAWFDWPTGREEELGELLFSLGFVLLVPLWLLQQRYAADAASSPA